MDNCFALKKGTAGKTKAKQKNKNFLLFLKCIYVSLLTGFCY